MRTAILISGHMRTFDRCFANQAWMVYRHFPDADFYVSTEPDEDAEKAKLIGSFQLDSTPQPGLEMLCAWGDIRIKNSPWQHAPYSISVEPVAVIGQIWRLLQVWRLVKNPAIYTRFIRIRPDLWFHHFTGPTEPKFPHSALTPWWGSFGGVNDRFAILGREAAERYFTTFYEIRKLVDAGCPLHPESLIKASLELGDCRLEQLDAEFSTLRKDGACRGPEITAGDIARNRLRDSAPISDGVYSPG